MFINENERKIIKEIGENIKEGKAFAGKLNLLHEETRNYLCNEVPAFSYRTPMLLQMVGELDRAIAVCERIYREGK